MLEIQDAIGRLARPGVQCGELYATMVAMAAEAGYAGHFMGAAEPRIRFTGHGVGLELDEFPFIAKGQTLELAEGMVLALEPKCIFPGLGVAGIENIHLVTTDGLQRLNHFPDEICIVT